MLSRVFKKTFSTAGVLLTWGQTTYGWSRTPNNYYYQPEVIHGFYNVTHVASGPYHLAFLTQDSQVYTVGYGQNGRLGNGSNANAQTPVKVNIDGKVTQLACGQRHTLALTDNGQVYAWGYGGRSSVFGCSWLGACNPLGTGPSQSSSTPVRVDINNVSQISAGNDFSLAVIDGQLYGWGQGLRNLFYEPSSLPTDLFQANFLLESKQTRIRKLNSTEKYAMILTENGRLYAVGKNIGGATATRTNAKTITDNILRTMTKINDGPVGGERIEDFQISANSLIFRTESGAVFYSGMHSKFMPTRFPCNVQPRSIWATRNSVGIIGENDRIYFINDPIIEDYDKEGEVMVCDDPNLKGTFKIGGSHLLRFALRQ